ncbi:MAG: NAD(P)H-hydrate dehydratase, partial [Muribaculaceae bacterium]|nr:NAD(P)H-hydrate dehydratase [Muribaculaceae bacterium]
MFYPTPKQMKTIEENSDKNGVSCRTLMQNAGGALTMLIYRIGEDRDITSGVVFICGSGNNGGDAFVAAKEIAGSNIPVTVVLACGDPATELSAEAYCDLSGVSGAEVLNLNDNIDKVFEKFKTASVIVDAVFGTGFHGFLPPQIKACFSYAQRCDALIIAADVPSGGDCLNGRIAEGTLKCAYTVTFGYTKIGMLAKPLSDCCGEIITADVGLNDKCCENIEYLPTLWDGKSADQIIPKRSKDSFKGDYGKLLNIAGSAMYSGAASLSTEAALRSGAGLVTLAASERVITRIAAAIPEATYMPLAEDKDGSYAESNAAALGKACADKAAISVGSGLTVTNSTAAIVKKVIKEAACPVILDADGINCAADNINIFKDAKNKLIITPHIGELARLAGLSTEDASADRLTLAVNLAREYNIIVVAKGVPTIIAGGGKALIIRAGNPGLARGGSGDVLTGIIAAFCAQGIDPLQAAAAGVFVHGKAADLAA